VDQANPVRVEGSCEACVSGVTSSRPAGSACEAGVDSMGTVGIERFRFTPRPGPSSADASPSAAHSGPSGPRINLLSGRRDIPPAPRAIGGGRPSSSRAGVFPPWSRDGAYPVLQNERAIRLRAGRSPHPPDPRRTPNGRRLSWMYTYLAPGSSPSPRFMPLHSAGRGRLSQRRRHPPPRQ